MSQIEKNKNSNNWETQSNSMNEMSVISSSKLSSANLSKMSDADVLSFLSTLGREIEEGFELVTPCPYYQMILHLMECHFAAKTVTPTTLISASRAPYATASRKLNEMYEAGLVEKRARTKSAKTHTLHPSDKLLEEWEKLSDRVARLGAKHFGETDDAANAQEYYFGGSYLDTRSISALQVLPEPIKVSGGIRVLVHGDPTFMVMDNLKRQFEQTIGTSINQRAFSIDRLRDEALRNAERKTSRYDIIAVDLPWIGEFAEKNVLMPLDGVLDERKLMPSDFQPAGWKAAHWDNRPYGIPSQTTPELFFYRKDLFSQAGIAPPTTAYELLEAAKYFHQPEKHRYGVAWNAARGTALGHTILMSFADFGQPIIDLSYGADGYSTEGLADRNNRATIDTERGLMAAEFLMELLEYSPHDILSMSWYERIKPYAEGRVAMAYGYTLLAPYFELDPTSPAYQQTGFLPHPAGAGAHPLAHVGGYVLGIPSNIAPERLGAATKALQVFTSPEAQKLYIQNGSRTNPRYSVSADREVKTISPIFEAIDEMTWRDELQFWARPPIPEISDIIQICGNVFHDMLRGIISPKEALRSAQDQADQILKPK